MKRLTIAAFSLTLGTILVPVFSTVILTAVSVYGRTSQPTLAQTLGWLQDSLNDEYGDSTIQTARGVELRALRLVKFAGCQVTFVYTATIAGKETFRLQSSFNLGVIDPEKVSFLNRGITSDFTGPFIAATQNAIKKIATKTFLGSSNVAIEGTDAVFLAGFYSDYGEDFAKEFKRSVRMCGGKRSLFSTGAKKP